MLKQNRGVKYGIIAGGITVGIYLLFYLINKELVFNSFLNWATVGLYLAIAWKSIDDERQALGGKLEFQQALKVGFTVFVVANLVYYLYYYLLHGVFDPGLEEVQRAVMSETLEARKGMLSEEQYDAFKESLEGDGLKVGLQNTLLTYARSLIGYFLISLGLAALASRK
ncbi:MAG: DUF4199 domain-containing protein [Phaeodactylibacter sp.]|uniref:DUF4199 domain-containing protein n=1 Tax=Phaeodactylibacter sp. TaxID=1940289 RepID=UPI0032EFDCDB